MEQSDLLRFVVDAIERLGLRYFVTGSTVTIFYGEPRFTNDIDIVVQLPAGAVRDFCRQFPDEDFYVSEEAALDAVQRRSQFNIIHPRSGLKVDVIIPAATEFNQSRFERATRVHAGTDWDAAFSSPEDAIIKKMEYFREGGAEKHLRDIIGVLKMSGEAIDVTYIERWASALTLDDIWRGILDRLRQT
jgi:hypothetical protein